MRHTVASQNDREEQAQIRWLVVGAAVWIWVFGTAMGHYVVGKTLREANSDAAAGAIATLIAWTVYHIVSGRNDNGSPLLVLSLPVISSNHSLGFLPTLGMMLLVGMPVAWLLGHWIRWYCSKAERSIPQSSDVLFEAEIDGIKKGY